jgi:hypothetical protein
MSHDKFPAPSQTREFEDKDKLRLVPVERLWKTASFNYGENGNYTPGQKEMNTNNGIVFAIDGNGSHGKVTYSEPGVLEEMQRDGYTYNPNGAVPVGNGLAPREMEEIMPDLAINRAARQSGAQNREATYTDRNGQEHPYVTSNPFEQGDFIEINRDIAEISQDGEKIWHVDLNRDKVADPDFVANVGKWNENNGVIEVITTAGDRQITKATDERRQRLADMGYTQNPDMAVAHANGEQWNTDRNWSQVNNPETGRDMGTAIEIWDQIAA